MPPSPANTDQLDALWAAYHRHGRRHGSPEEDALARIYLPYATQIGDRFHRTVGGVGEREEVLQNGYLGLLEAIRTFNAERATFRTYANRKIQWKIRDGLRAGDLLPRRRRANVTKIHAALQRLAQTTPGGAVAVTDDMLAEATNLTVDDVRIACEDSTNARVHSFSDLTGDDTDPTEYRFADTSDPLDARVLRQDSHDDLYDAIRTLRERDKQILALYYYENFTQEEIGRVYGIGHARVSQILSRASLALHATLKPTSVA